ncbi:uncharacterized protein BX664DRAFT_262675 [Halteromyces radiatus]|uniref:uncharacterized protein n=1 Tax=Halteromyces radiatus TaxID=101107 RepID=UPI00221EBA9D|nr:uncharacterized protein BX664DRAFT_262675 [Halteromyces radiatus]KAI8089411.1 hypothetical protein BX664DRAFT_262675 [Halteromyces radiatus]
MPDRLPLTVFVRQCLKRLVYYLKTLLRAIIVAIVWLVILPYSTLCTWRFYFWSGETIGFFTNTTKNVTFNILYIYNRSFLSDCFEGQVITAFVIVIFIAAYLFREWAMQNLPVEEEPQEDEEHLGNQQHNFNERQDTPNEDNEDQLREQQQVAIDTLLHAIQNINTPNNDIEAERNELHARLAEMRRVLEQKRNLTDEQQTGSSTPHNTTYEERNTLPSWLLDDDDDDDNLSTPEFSEEDDDEEEQHTTSLYNGTMNPPTAPAPAPAPPPPPPPAAAAIVEENENDEGGDDEMEPFDFGDDIDGVLEAVGMRGNPWMLLQNSVLMSLMVSLCLGVAVWIPYVVGRLVISIKPMSFIQTPISVMRLLTDPLVDFILDRGIPLVWTWLTTKLTFNTFVPDSILLATNTLMTRLHTILDDFLLPSGYTNMTTLDTTLQWTNLQQAIESMGDNLLKRWQQFAIGQSGLDRTICILVGYLVLVLIGSWYLGAGQHGDTVQDILRQQGDFLKVVFFIVIELVIFPLSCGVLLDGCTLPLFVDASVASRWAFYQSNPYSSCFLHWFFGTGFLFGVAVFVALCREVVRPGVIWFIRDPNDPQFHPIREMIERPTLPLLQKIAHSAMMYAGLITAAIGTVVYTLDYMTDAFPLFVPLDTPFSTLSLDLLAVQFLLSPLISYLEPREYAKYILDSWWRWTSRQLRLTSFMFDGRYPEEEGSHVRHTFKAWLLRQQVATIPSGNDDDHVYGDVGITQNGDQYSQQHTQAAVTFQRNGQLLRVPKLDTVPVIPRRRMLVPVDPVTLEAIDEEERRLGHPAASQSGDEDLSTIIVYAPPHFKSRLIVFIVLMWLSSSFLTCTLTVVPVCLGRYLFKAFVTEKAVHDVYSFATGAYVMVSLGLAIDWTMNKYQAWQDGSATSTEILEWTKEKLQLCGKVLYLATTLGFIVPLLLGVMVDLYLFMPLRYSIHDDQPMVLHLSEDWVFGIAYCSIIYGVIQVLPNNRWQHYFNRLIGNGGLANMSSWVVTRSFVGPVILGTILAITIPGILAWGCVQWLGMYIYIYIYKMVNHLNY